MQESEASIYVVGGLPRTGKTTVAERLAHDLRIGSMETDHIRVLFKPTPTSKIRTDSGEDIKVVTKKLRPRLESLVEWLANGNIDFVLNGECIDPRMVAASPYQARIRSCFMGLNDPDGAFARIREVADPSDWANQKSDEELRRILEKYAARSQALAKTCMKLTLPYVDASADFTMAQEWVYETLTQGS